MGKTFDIESVRCSKCQHAPLDVRVKILTPDDVGISLYLDVWCPRCQEVRCGEELVVVPRRRDVHLL